jgi:NAD(P)-dependent dehydrogenase (short-subunit alcohol dehydrogenase family)
MAFGSRSLTVVVIAHNNAATIAAAVERIYHALTITVEKFRIAIYDDASTDVSWQIAERLREQIPFVTAKRSDRFHGRGHYIVPASREADTAFIIYVPADNEWPLRALIELFGHIGKADIITSHPVNLFPAMAGPQRFASRSYSFVLNLLFGRNIRYYNGLTIYPTQYLRYDPIGTAGIGFQAEALIKAIAAGYSFLELTLPVDVENLPARPSITAANLFDAASTIVRLILDVHVLRRVAAYHPTPAVLPSGGQSASELGVGEAVRKPLAPAERQAMRRIVIVGASGGIGSKLTQDLAGDGHRLFAAARRTARLAQLAEHASNLRSYFCDVADEASVADFVAALQRETEAVDVLINCAGTFGEIGSIEQTDSVNWWRTLEINLRGTYLMIKHALPLLEAGQSPCIINLAGGGAFSAFANYSAYACSKAAVVRLTECLAEELFAKGVRVNALAPGFLPTEMHEATLAAGEKRAGTMQFQRTLAIKEQGPGPMNNAVDCVRALISPAMSQLTGKTISSNFDPWQADVFREQVLEITRSDLYSMRRIDIANLPQGRLRSILSGL